MADYRAEADIVLSVNVSAEGVNDDPAAIEAAKQDLLDKINSGEINLNDAAYIQDVQIYNLRRVA
jgi:hypothetical protein